MRRLAYLCLAIGSVAAASLQAATRPRYGGTLRVQLISMFVNPETLPLVSETLIRFDEHGEARPGLARGWQSDAVKKRWTFIVRARVALPSRIARVLRPVLKRQYGDVVVTSNTQSIIIQSEKSMPDLLARLARPETGIPGTGPFHVTLWEPGRRAVLAANESYPGGRPFVDSIEFSVATQRTYQLGAADIWELPVGISRRSIPEWMRVWTSTALDLIALKVVNAEGGLRVALSLSIDRAAIVNVLTQRRGEVALGLLPQWLTGYEFLFSAAYDVARAREAASSLKGRTFTLGVPAADTLSRSVADRIAVNARDAGLTLVPPQGANADVQLLHIRLDCAGADRALREIAEGTDLGDLASPETLYHAERRVLEESRLIPVIHVPRVFGIGPRVHGSTGMPVCDLPNEIPNLWLTP
jgi:peptide/nickel transport system substrate-binding protein